MFLEKKCERCRKLFTNKRKNGYFLGVKQFRTRRFCSKRCRGVKLEKKCEYCDEVFVNNRRRISLGTTNFQKRRFCSQSCLWKSSVGRKLLESTIYKIALANMGEKSPRWKGDKVGYRGLHLWVERQLGKSDICENCKKSGLKGSAIHWSNKSGVYNRNQNDWQRLCARCHYAYDKKLRLKIKERTYE